VGLERTGRIVTAAALLFVASPRVLRRPALAEARRVLDACPTIKFGLVLTGTERELGAEEPRASLDGYPDGDAGWTAPARASGTRAGTPS